MQVFKVFFRIIRKNLPEILIYLVVFLLLAIFLSSANTGSQNTGFMQTKTRIVFVNNDENSSLVQGLRNYLAENSAIVEMNTDDKTLQDALFFRDIEYIVKVPQGFTQEFYDNKDVKLNITKIPDSISGVYMDNMIDKYLNTAKIYINNINNISDKDLIKYIEADLSQGAEVSLSSTDAVQSKDYLYYYNYSAYSLSAIMILGVCSVMLVFSRLDLKRRNLCSPMKSSSLNMQLILGNLVFASVTWLMIIITSMIIYGSDMFTISGALFFLNSFVFTLAMLSISFLISNIIKSRAAMSAAANVVALGSSFISGVFIPQYLLGEKVLKIASFTPTYWYVRANNITASLAEYNAATLAPVFKSMLIVLAFAAAVLAVTLVLTKQRKTVS